MPRYRVTAGRWDIPDQTIATFPAENDEAAKIRFFENYKYNPNYKWDALKLIRIDQEEKTTVIEIRIPK